MDVHVVLAEERGGWTVVRVHGDIDVAVAPRLRERLVQVVADGHHHVVLDLDDVHFIDSTGLGVVIGLLKRTRSLGGDLRLVSTREMLARVFEITRLDRVLPISASVDDALAAPDTRG